MASTRRERNKNFFKWEPVVGGNNLFTPNAPLDWFYEIIEPSETRPCEDDSSPDVSLGPDQDELATAKEVVRMTPTNDELLRTAQQFPPPPGWFDGDEEQLF